jgi:hypothetical protein
VQQSISGGDESFVELGAFAVVEFWIVNFTNKLLECNQYHAFVSIVESKQIIKQYQEQETKVLYE